jgi:hypothetical protein
MSESTKEVELSEDRPRESELDEAPEGASDEARLDEETIRDPSPEQDPESGPATEERQEGN